MQVGDTGAPINVALTSETGAVLDITGATSIVFYLKSPTGVTKTRNGSIVSASAGTVRYTTVAGDIDRAGTWRVQVSYVLGAFSGRSSVGIFAVGPNI